MQKTQQTPGPAQCIYFKYSLWLEPDHVWVSGLEHERIALSSAPSPASPGIVYGSAESTFLIPPRSGREAAAQDGDRGSFPIWPSQRAGYLLEGRGLITTRWAKSAQMVLLKPFPSAQRPAPPEVSWQYKDPHFADASPTSCLTPATLSREAQVPTATQT